jgi:hypothetical protein
MSNGWGGPFQDATTVEQAYFNLRKATEQLEEILEATATTMDEKCTKRCDKAVTVTKIGLKILKKTFGLHKTKLRIAA